jgi:hypothetical protein
MTRDPDDNIFVECADAARADYLVTGDLRHVSGVLEEDQSAQIAGLDRYRRATSAPLSGAAPPIPGTSGDLAKVGQLLTDSLSLHYGRANRLSEGLGDSGLPSSRHEDGERYPSRLLLSARPSCSAYCGSAVVPISIEMYAAAIRRTNSSKYSCIFNHRHEHTTGDLVISSMHVNRLERGIRPNRSNVTWIAAVLRSLLAGALDTYRDQGREKLTEIFLHSRSAIDKEEFEVRRL